MSPGKSIVATILGSSLLPGAVVPVHADQAHYDDRNLYVAPRATDAAMQRFGPDWKTDRLREP
jgi:hypothetical protein